MPQTKRILPIDGLRAIAVVSVLLNHIHPELFLGGFIGVDIFFVISGFLITNWFLNKRSNIGILGFYSKRVRRIIPVYFFMLSLTSVIVLILLTDTQITDYFFALRYALLFVPNFFFIGDNYFSPEISGSTILLHTWSLGIEEQFYIFFPILVSLFFYFKLKLNPNWILLLIIINLLFVQFSGNLTKTYPFFENDFNFFSQSYYFSYFSPLSRIWEFALGIYISRLSLELNKNLTLFLQIISLLCIASFIIFNTSFVQPNLLTSLPVISASILIFFSREDNFINRFLSTKVFTFLGLISYSIYLWHQPVLIIFKLIYPNHSLFALYVLIIPIVILGFMSFKFIEERFNK